MCSRMSPLRAPASASSPPSFTRFMTVVPCSSDTRSAPTGLLPPLLLTARSARWRATRHFYKGCYPPACCSRRAVFTSGPREEVRVSYSATRRCEGARLCGNFGSLGRKTHREVVFVIESCLFCICTSATRNSPRRALASSRLDLAQVHRHDHKVAVRVKRQLGLGALGGGLRLSDAMSTPFATATLHSAIASVRCAADKLPSAFGSSFNGASRSIFAVLVLPPFVVCSSSQRPRAHASYARSAQRGDTAVCQRVKGLESAPNRRRSGMNSESYFGVKPPFSSATSK